MLIIIAGVLLKDFTTVPCYLSTCTAATLFALFVPILTGMVLAATFVYFATSTPCQPFSHFLSHVTCTTYVAGDTIIIFWQYTYMTMLAALRPWVCMSTNGQQSCY
jgi:hypothetical protein